MTTSIYDVHQLQAASGVSQRTLRHWTRKKLLPKPLGRGRGARYTEEHVARAMAVQYLRSQRLSLARIRTRLEPLTLEQLKALVPPKPAPGLPEAVPPPPAEPCYPFTTWEVIELLPGLALMVNPSRGPAARRIADDIYKHYRGG